MNKRIKELVINGYGYPILACLDGEDAKKEFLEKFAEVIVRECARFVHKAQPNGLALDVLEHFGVE